MEGDDEFQIDLQNNDSPGTQGASSQGLAEADPRADQARPDSAAAQPRAASPAQEEKKSQPAAPTADPQSPGEQSPGLEDREPKLFVDVNVANFGLQRIIVYDGDTVDSLVADFVKRCPIDEFMVEKLKLLLQQ